MIASPPRVKTFALTFAVFCLLVHAAWALPGTEKWAFPTGGFADSSPVVGKDGTLNIGSNDSNLYAIRSTSKGLAKSAWPMFLRDGDHSGLASYPYPVVTAVTAAPSPVAWGEKLNVKATVANDGYETLPSTVSYYLTPSSGNDMLLGRKNLGNLKAEKTKTQKASFPVPVGTTSL